MFKKDDSSVSEISSYSLSVYFLFVLIGFLIEIILFSKKVLSSDLSLYIGLGIILIGTAFIFWAMHGGHKYRKQGHRYEDLEHHHLKIGVFKFTRNPHYLGMGLMVLGLGMVTNSLAILVLAGLSFVVVNAWFIPHEEAVLAKRHGEHFDKYKDSTRRWF